LVSYAFYDCPRRYAVVGINVWQGDNMSWLKLPGDTQTPELERITKPYRERGGVPSIVAALKPNPKALKAVLRMNTTITFGGSTLGREREELISSAVSALNQCFY
jgi:hypothetical protein